MQEKQSHRCSTSAPWQEAQAQGVSAIITDMSTVPATGQQHLVEDVPMLGPGRLSECGAEGTAGMGPLAAPGPSGSFRWWCLPQPKPERGARGSGR